MKWHLKILPVSGFSALEFADGGTCWRSDTVMTTACTAKTEQEQSPHAREWQRVWFIKSHGERAQQHEVSSFDTH